MKKIITVVLLLCLVGYTNAQTRSKTRTSKISKMKEIYFAGGCFWGTEHFLKQINGVIKTEVGYANGHTKNPTYKEVCTGETGFAETVKVTYHPDDVALKFLINLFFKTIDPTSLNRQGNDRGTQYRTGIYYTTKEDISVIQSIVSDLAKAYSKPLVIEILPLTNFYAAEGYHQDYLDKNPGGYCHIGVDLFEMARKANKKSNSPKKVFQKLTETELRTKLTSVQYAVTQQNATEKAFSNEYWNEKREGIYVDITTGEPLFISTDKFDSGCGWPSFSKPIDKKIIVEKKDTTHGMQRVEVRSSTGDSHLGHLFNDGPANKGGLRYCINSASLRFIPKDKMQAEGYADYIHLLENK